MDEKPRDQLGSYSGYTLDAMGKLTDDQLTEQIAFWRVKKGQSTGRDIMGYRSLISVGQRLLDIRQLKNPPREWTRQFTTSHPCHICGTEAVAVEDDGWVCADHRTNSADREGTGESIPSSG